MKCFFYQLWKTKSRTSTISSSEQNATVRIKKKYITINIKITQHQLLIAT